MSRSLYLVVFVLAVALAYASSQTAGTTNSTPNQKGEPQSSAQAGQSANRSNQTDNGSPEGNNPSTSVPGGATDASGGGVVGAAGATTGKTQVPETPDTSSAAAVVPDKDLQNQIQNALSKEPTLSGDTVNITVSANDIEMNGSVATAREKQTATRIVQSYAGNKKVVSHLTITGRERNAAPNGNDKQTSDSQQSNRPPR
jgi:osmotically-inducible protein OsmY